MKPLATIKLIVMTVAFSPFIVYNLYFTINSYFFSKTHNDGLTGLAAIIGIFILIALIIAYLQQVIISIWYLYKFQNKTLEYIITTPNLIMAIMLICVNFSDFQFKYILLLILFIISLTIDILLINSQNKQCNTNKMKKIDDILIK